MVDGRIPLNEQNDGHETFPEPPFAQRAEGRMASRGVRKPTPALPAVDGPLHVAPGDDGWRVTVENGATVAVLRTKNEAMAHARELADAHDVRLVEHGADGRIR